MNGEVGVCVRDEVNPLTSWNFGSAIAPWSIGKLEAWPVIIIVPVLVILLGIALNFM
jgi:hypothetical protein